MKKLLWMVALSGLALGMFSCKPEKGQDEDVDSKEFNQLDVSAYDKWVYVSLEDQAVTTLHYQEAAPEKWDIAMHRNNIRTNGAGVLKTQAVNLSELTVYPSGDFVADSMSYTDVAVDMSGMMQGNVVYDTVAINPVLNTWVTFSGVPPVYTVAPQVYVLRFPDGRYAKIRFESYKSDLDKTGFATFSYVFPW